MTAPGQGLPVSASVLVRARVDVIVTYAATANRAAGDSTPGATRAQKFHPTSAAQVSDSRNPPKGSHSRRLPAGRT